MAKQRGIHQISGKINNLCYYEQKYVRGGLIRRINEAMSERLKTDPVFANTRRANKIFGGCSIVARALLEFFGSRNTYLFKPYRHALLTKAVQKFLLDKTSGSMYPNIISGNTGTVRLPSIIDSIVKNNIRNSFPELPAYIGEFGIDDTYTFEFTYQSLLNFCKMYNCEGVQISISRSHYIYSTYYDSDNESYYTPDTNAGGRGYSFTFRKTDPDEEVIINANLGTIDDATTFFIVYAVPVLSFNGGRPITGETGASCGIVTFDIR